MAMSITAECNACGKRYQAPSNMAGRRVRCKQCGNIFELPAVASSPSEPDLDALAEMERSHHNSDSASSTLNSSGIVDEPPSEDDAEQGSAAPPLRTGRTNVRFAHPYARELDQWVPLILSAGGLVWLGIETFRRDDSGVGWLAAVRLGIALVAYTLFVTPMTLSMIRVAGRRLGYQMPLADRWRAFACYLPAFVLGCVMWLAGGGSVVGLVLGSFIGIIVATTALWLLFRLKPREIAPSAAYATLGFFIGLALAAGLFFGLNVLLINVLVAAKRPDLIPASPIAQGMPWIPSDQAAKALTTATSDQARPIKSKPVSPDTAKTAPAPQAQPAPAPQASIPQAPVSALPVAPAPPAPAPVPVIPQPVQPQPPLSPVVRAIDPVQIEGQFDEVLYPLTQTTGATFYVATLRRSGSNATIDLWDTDTWLRKGSAMFANAEGAGSRFVVSPDGTYVSRIAAFPRRSVQSWSFPQRRNMGTGYPLEEKYGMPELVGFVGDKRLLIRWQRDSACGLEIIDVSTSQSVKRFDTASFDREGSTLAISPDASLAAVAAKVQGLPLVLFYNLETGRELSRAKVPLDPQWPVTPTGMAFSPDASRLAVLFEQAGQGLLLAYRCSNGQPIGLPHILPAGPLPERDTHQFSGNALAWLPDSKSWLLYGEGIFDPSTGTQAASLGVSGIQNARVVRPDTVQIVTRSTSGQKQINLIRLDMPKIAEMLQPEPNHH